jgi:hypothetical protein
MIKYLGSGLVKANTELSQYTITYPMMDKTEVSNIFGKLKFLINQNFHVVG